MSPAAMTRVVVANVRESIAGRASLVMEVRIMMAVDWDVVVLRGAVLRLIQSMVGVDCSLQLPAGGWSDQARTKSGELFARVHVTQALSPAFCRP